MARIVALAITIALHVGVLLLITGKWQPFPARDSQRGAPPAETKRTPTSAAGAAPVTEVLDWTRIPAAPARSSSEIPESARRTVIDLEQARAAGREHARRQRNAIRRLWQRQYGDAIAALLDAPVEQGWPALEQLTREADGVAAEALLELADRCGDGIARPEPHARFIDEAAYGLDPLAAAFVRAALEQEREYRSAHVQSCLKHGVSMQSLYGMLRERGVEPRGSLFAAFRDAFHARRSPNWQGPSGAALDRATSAEGLDEEDWIALLAEAESDPAVAYAIGSCLQGNCTHFPELPESERRRLSRAAADAGNVWAARALAEDLANGGDLGSAYGWMLFARWADASGCNPVATTLDLADTLRGIASLEAVLTPGQRNAGEVLGASLIAANAAGARSVWSCPG